MVNVLTPAQSYAMSLDDDEEDMEDAEDYLQKAKQKANSSNFSGASEELKKAKRLGVLRDDVKDTESYVQKAERNYEARLQAQRDRQAKIEADRIEKEKQAELSKRAKELMDRLNQNSVQNYSSSSSSSSSTTSSDVNFVSVKAEFTRGILNSSLAKNLQMSAVDSDAFIGEYNHNHGAYGAIYKGINGIAGWYNYSFQSDSGKISCSGRIYLSGKKSGLVIDVYDTCKKAGTYEF